MRSLKKICVLCALLVISAQAANEINSFKVNGLKVVLKENTANEIISAQLYIRGGALNLSAETQGIEQFIFDCALKGSHKYPKDELNIILDKTAAQINGTAGRDFSLFSLRTIKSNFDLTWDVFSDVVMHPLFEPDEVELVRENMISDIKQRKDDADTYLSQLARAQFYKDHPYNLDPLGTEEAVQNITIDQMRTHHKNILQTTQLLFVVVGNITQAELTNKLEDSFAKLPVGNYKPVYPEAVKHEKANLVTVQRDLPTNYITGFMSAPDQNDTDFYPVTMLMRILQGRMWDEVRTKRNLSYAPQAYFSNSFANRVAIYVTAVDPDTTIKVMLNELKKIQDEAVTQKDLNDQVSMYITRYYRANETNAAQGQFLARYELSGLGWQVSEEYVNSLRKVTPDDVQRVAKKYLKNIQFAVLGNPDLIDKMLFTSM
jgi:zinc protease